MLEFYLTLLTIQFTFFGIFSAVLFFYSQFLSQTVSPRLVKQIFKNFWIYIFVFFQLIGLALSAVASYYFAFLQYNILLPLNLSILNFFKSQISAVIDLGITFIAFLLVIFLFWRFAQFIQTKKLIKILFKKIDPFEVRNFSYAQFQVEPPNEWEYSDFPLRFSIVEENEKKEEIIKSRRHKTVKQIIEEFKIKFNDFRTKKEIINFKQYIKILKNKQSEGMLNDPFDDLFVMVYKAIKEGDISVWDFFNQQTTSLFREWKNMGYLDKRHKLNEPFRKSHRALEYIIKNLIFHLTHAYDLIKNTNQRSFLVSATNTLKELFKIVPSQEYATENQIIESLNILLKEAIDSRDYILTKHLFGVFLEIAEITIDTNEQEMFDEVMRSLGKYGEYLLLKLELEEKPIMASFREATITEYSTYVLYAINKKLIENSYEVHPIILVDAVWLITEKILQKASSRRTFTKELVDLLGLLSDMAKKAIELNKNNIFWLATIRLSDFYEKSLKDWDYEIPEDIAHWLAEIGATAANNNAEVKDVILFDENIDKRDRIGLVISCLKKITNYSHLNSAISEVYFHHNNYGGHDKIWEFITRAGKILQTNFGFMFDWGTGQLYPKDDTRRR